jgi:hypothetical protein
MVIYLLMTRTDIHDWVNKTEPFLEVDFICFGRHVIGPIRTGKQPEYSEQLRNLVRECLQPAIAKRPTVTRLVTRTRAGMEIFRTTSRTGRDTKRPPKLIHLKHSQSGLCEQRPAAAQPRQSDQGAAISHQAAKPKAPTWEPRQASKRPRTHNYVVAPIAISSSDDDDDILPAPLPPATSNERDGKQRYYYASEEFVSAGREITTNIAGDVIAISSDSTSAAEQNGGHMTTLDAGNPNDFEATNGGRIQMNEVVEPIDYEEDAPVERSSWLDQLP